MKVLQYPLNQLIVLDCAVNAILGGSPYETLSVRIGRILAYHGREEFKREHRLLWLVERCLNLVDCDHCSKEAKRAATRPPGWRQIWGE